MLFGFYVVATALWLIATITLSLWVTRVYVNALIATRLGKVRRKSRANMAALRRMKDPPFITVILPTFNEAHVSDRLISAATAIDYPRYEVIVADDSTDAAALRSLRKWESRGKVKLVHRAARKGFKSGAVNNALRHADPRRKYVAFFDADYVPGKDVLWQLLSDFTSDDIAVVQGYTSHTLNAPKNAFTKSTRIAFSYYCLSDVAVREHIKGFIPIFGSIFMITRSALEDMNGLNEASITEDWDLACRLSEKGYRIVFDESISAPAECPSTFRGLIKQQMRWSEGIVRDTKNNLVRIMTSDRTSLLKKFDYLFYGFSSFNGALGSISYALSVMVFLINARLLTAIGVDRGLILGFGALGQFALYVAPFYLPLAFVVAALVALYREGKLSLFPWCVYALAMSLAFAPFIAYAAARGLFLKSGSWDRTPKTGELVGN